MEGVLTTVETSFIASHLRTSVDLYPAVSALHILGIALLVGTIIALDLHILGFRRSVGQRAVGSVLRPVAVVGFLLAVTTGGLLFSVRARDYAQNPAMLLKLASIAVAGVNAAIFQGLAGSAGGESRRCSALARASAALSALLWLVVLFSGRWIAFLD